MIAMTSPTRSPSAVEMALHSEKNLEALDNVLFFDGMCGLCNFWVDFVLREDHQRRIRFSPLQGRYAERSLPPQLLQNLDSVVFIQNGQTFQKSAAIIQVLKLLGGRLNMVGFALS